MVRLAASLALSACLAMSACGGGRDAQPDASNTPTAEATATPAPEALSGFRCQAGDDGTWTASGTLANSGSEAASYGVDLYVGPADGQERPVAHQDFENVQPGGSVPIEFPGLSAQGDPATCYVRVLRLL
ncbi:MAG: hypothetical protein QM597_10350 [Aeromicrobium sp.]|uniref:hypothetical protein n=1 Tax=Aeromicrobium sp. TaxID=1871063 RepID=UPI0039E59A26